MVELRSSGPPPSKDQDAIIEAYFRGGRFCIDAGAGTGKTTTLVRILSGITLENFERSQLSNPMDRILAVTFGAEASRDIRGKLRSMLKEHFALGGQPAVEESKLKEFWRFFETESNIQTIDALFMSLLREIATFVRIPPTFDIPSAIERDEIIAQIIQTVRKDQELDAKWLRVEDRYSFESSYGGPHNLQDMLLTIHQKMREFCWSPPDVRRELNRGLDSIIHSGKAPPISVQEVREILSALGWASAYIVSKDDDQVVNYAKETYALNHTIINEFADLVEAFDREYDRVTKSTGALTHTDIAYHVWKFVSDPSKSEFRSSLRNRYDHVLVDEFQDTSYVQYSVLLEFLRDDPPNNVLFIGDVKQSIYQWRSADPTIFAKLIDESSNKKPSAGIGYLGYFALVTNFRSHPDLLHFFNGMFSRMFEQPSRGKIDITVHYKALKPQDIEFAGGSRIHVIRNAGENMPSFIASETRDIVEVINGILGPGGLEVRDKKSGKHRKARAGDIGILFRRGTHVESYADALRRAGHKVAILTDTSIFAEPEISLIVDLFDWLANPDSRDPLLRVLRSPLVAMSDEVLRYLASKDFVLYSAVDSWPKSLPTSEMKKLQDLVDLRNDLRWDREGKKSELLERIIAFSGLDSVLLAGDDGLQAQANLWQLVEYVSSLEEEQLVTYSRFVHILKLLREKARMGKERDYGRAVMALPGSEETITIMTVHGAKGLEYPILIIADCNSHVPTSDSSAQFIAHRERGLMLKPQPPDLAQPFTVFPSPTERPLPWVAWGEGGAMLWVSTRRDPSTGRLLRDSPIDSELKAQVSEFWRLLYVAATRARDHLIFSIAPKIKSDWNRWNSWMPFLRDSLGFVPEDNGTTPKPVGLTEGGTPTNVLVGVDDLPRVRAVEHERLPDLDWAAIEYSPPKRDIPSFVPRSINPSDFFDLLECPRKYQYEAVWQIAGVRSDATPGSKHPEGIDADDWGKEVHSLMEHRHFDLSPESDLVRDKLELHLSLGRRSQQAKELMVALGNLEASPLGVQIIESTKRKLRFYTELSFAYPISTGGLPPIEVKGQVDRTFEVQKDEWWIADYKAEVKPPPGSYMEKKHRMQINAYSWALRKVYGINAIKGVVAYVYPSAGFDEFVPDPDAFEQAMNKALTTLALEDDPTRGLIARENAGLNQICQSCGYSARKGGPCERYP